MSSHYYADRRAASRAMYPRTAPALDKWGTALEPAVQRLVDARVSLLRLEDAYALQGVDDYHDAMRAVSHAAQALGVGAVEFDALARAQRQDDDGAAA